MEVVIYVLLTFILICTANEESSNSNNTDTPKVVEEIIALDVAINTELVNSINYNDAYNEYQNYYSKNDVTIIQEKLNSLEINCGDADGFIGKKTIAAVVHFQEFNNLKLTGIVDERTASKMNLSYKEFDANKNKNGKQITVSLSRSYLEYNNSVGNDWGTSIEVNGENIRYDSLSFTIKKGDSFRILDEASEDDSVVDYGSKFNGISDTLSLGLKN